MKCGKQLSAFKSRSPWMGSFSCFFLWGGETSGILSPELCKGFLHFFLVRGADFLLNRKRIVCSWDIFFPHLVFSLNFCAMHCRLFSPARKVVCLVRQGCAFGVCRPPPRRLRGHWVSFKLSGGGSGVVRRMFHSIFLRRAKKAIPSKRCLLLWSNRLIFWKARGNGSEFLSNANMFWFSCGCLVLKADAKLQVKGTRATPWP